MECDKGMGSERGKDDVIVPRLLFLQDCMACNLERVWKLNLRFNFC